MYHRFDPASILILQRLDTLEGLVRGSTLSPRALPATAELSLAQVPLNTPGPTVAEGGLQTLERTETSNSYHINFESILSWPVFKSCKIGQNRDLKALLKSSSAIPGRTALAVPLEVENGRARQLLQRFIRHVHIYNPVLDIEKVQEDMRDTLFNGLEWDAKSCLLVSKLEIMYQIPC